MALPYEEARRIFDNAVSSKNYPGSSGYWGDLPDTYRGSRYGLGYPGDVAKTELATSLGLSPTTTTSSFWNTSGTTQKETPVLGADNRWYSSTTGKLFSGTDAAGKTYNNGYEQQNVNDRYKAVEVVKDQPVADEASKLLDTFKTAAASSLKDFDSHVNDFNSDVASARAKANTATDIGGTEAALRGMQGKYNTSLDTASNDYARLNAENAAAERALVARAEGVLPEYDQAALNIGDRMAAALGAQESRYKRASGTPRSMGSSDTRRLLRNQADVYLPLEQQRIARKLDLIQNLSLPVQRDIYGNERARISQFNPEIARQEFATGQATEQTIQGLRQAVANMSYDSAQRYMQALGVPDQLRQQIISSQISSLGAIGQLNEMSRYRGLQDLQGAYPSQPQYFNLGVPGYPSATSPISSGGYPSRYGQETGNTLPTQSPPVTVRPSNTPLNYDEMTPAQINALTGRAADEYWASQGAYPAELPTTYSRGRVSAPSRQSNSYYDERAGVYRDRTTGEITGYAPGYGVYTGLDVPAGGTDY